MLLLPALMLYLYGPREDRPPDFPRAGARAGCVRATGCARDVLWLALAPAGLGVYMLYLGLAGGDALAPFHAQDVWSRHFAGPYVGVWDGLQGGLRAPASCSRSSAHHVYFPAADRQPVRSPPSTT